MCISEYRSESVSRSNVMEAKKGSKKGCEEYLFVCLIPTCLLASISALLDYLVLKSSWLRVRSINLFTREWMDG